MELLALFAIAFATAIGWVICGVVLPQIISPAQRFYFAPAIGLGVCGVIGYVAVRFHMPWLILVFTLLSLAGGAAYIWRRLRLGFAPPDGARLVKFTVFTLLCLYGMQIALYGLFSRVYPGPHEVWTVFNLTGVPPPDQMFAWHQAMFFAQHRVYPDAPFYGEMDLYDRPQFGGCITLFFFKLFRLPLKEKEFAYPAAALHFYHCLWWLLNNLYLLGIAPLFRRLFGLRGAILAVASTALGGFFILSNTGGWMKFASAYPFVLAFLLFIEGKGPVLQALLCAMSYYIHGSVLPFLAGFGALQLLSVRYPIATTRTSIRNVMQFSCVGVLLVGAWFVLVRWVGSKQPLFYYYIYDASLTEAQTRPVSEIARDFYAKHSWQMLAFLPVHNLWQSLFPTILFDSARAWFWANGPGRLSDLGSALFASQRFCIPCALAAVSAPFVILGALRSLAQKHGGKIALCLYLLPALMIALIYRKDWAFQLHVVCLYHTLVLFCWIAFWRRARTRWALLGLSAITVEGIVCLLFADFRILPVTGLRLNELRAVHWSWLLAYLLLTALILVATARELIRCREDRDGVVPAETLPPLGIAALAAGKVFAGAAIVAAVVGVYGLYCLRYY